MLKPILLSTLVLAMPAWGADRDALQYQWTDPKTGKVVTKDYPPANLQMRQVERRGNLVILEVIGQSKFSDAVSLNKPKSVELSESDAPAKNCFNAVKANLKDPYSAVLESVNGVRGFTETTGAVRQTITIYVNAKNSYGGYVGATPHTCVLQMDNLTVSHVEGV